MDERVYTCIRIISYKMLCFASPRRSYYWANIVSYPLFAIVIKNKITSSETHNYMSVEDRIMNE